MTEETNTETTVADTEVVEATVEVTQPAMEDVADDHMVLIHNRTATMPILEAFDGSSIHIPPRFKGRIKAKFLKWNKPNPRIISIKESLYKTVEK